MQLQLLKDTFCICKLYDLSKVNTMSDFFFISKTDSEISLVCKEFDVPNNCNTVDKGWKALRVVGILDFSLVGILSNISKVLANVGVPIFAVSTFDTDYILVKQEYITKSIIALKDSKYTIVE